MAKIDLLNKVRKEISKVIVGQDELIHNMIICFFCEGHLLLRGLPGLAKTTLVHAIANVFGIDFKRVQFTPDLMPSDLIGYELLEENKGKKDMRFIKGPLFTHVLLADEINRTPPKTQAALLQAMQEREITVMGKTYSLDAPFLVMATQNPIEQEGTYPLPEAQLDRFMFMLNVDYPSFDEEVLISEHDSSKKMSTLNKLFSIKEIKQHIANSEKIKIAKPIVRWIVKLVQSTRPESEFANKQTKEFISYGASPRASKYIIQAAKAYAYLEGATEIEKHHIEQVAFPILRHRIQLNFTGEAESFKVENYIGDLLKLKI